MTAEKLESFKERVATIDVAGEQDRAVLGVAIACAVGVAGLPAIGAAILAMTAGRAAIRYALRELAVGAMLALDARRQVDLRTTPDASTYRGSWRW